MVQNIKQIVGLTFIIALLAWPSAEASSANADDTARSQLIIDDFQSGDGQAVFGTAWSGFSDRVMGGRSDINLAYQRLENDQLSLRLSGSVRLENNGGFIQARLPLERDGQRFDASEWTGIKITARAAPGAYYIHLRSRATWLPWQYYAAPIPVHESSQWQTVTLPFEAFKGESTRRALDVSSLKSIAVVAYGEAFEADIEVIELAFYRADD